LYYTRSALLLPCLLVSFSVSSSSSAAALSSTKYSRAVSSISSILQKEQGIKRIKLLDLQAISLSTFFFVILLNFFRDFFNNKGTFFKYLEQKLLVKSILLKVPYILKILATNKRKTLSYFLTASLITSKITIAVLSLVGFKADFLKKTKDFRILTSIYKNSNSFATLTLVSIETVGKIVTTLL
jgi:hypothetical protein